jgi:hypothetical protein
MNREGEGKQLMERCEYVNVSTTCMIQNHTEQSDPNANTTVLCSDTQTHGCPWFASVSSDMCRDGRN